MGPETLAVLCLVAFFVLLMVGIPVAFALGISGFLFGYIGFGLNLFNLIPGRIFGVVTNYTLLAIPLFVFMGVVLEKSRIAEDLMDVIGYLARGVNGGMAIGIILIGVLMGASTGIVGATVVTLGLLTLPTLLRRGYDPGLAAGTICASGTLGQIIPPSLILVLLSDIMGQPLGTLFAAAIVPGLMLAGLYCVYILLIGFLRPDLAPAIPKSERIRVSAPQLFFMVVKTLLPPLALIFAVLGSIIGGVAAPTEAASMGALGSILVAALFRRLTWPLLRDVVTATTKITAMVMLILICAQVFSLAFRGLQGEGLVQGMMKFVPGEVTGKILFLMLLLFVLGFFIEWIEISYIALPLFLPIFVAAEVDMVWLATLVCVNLQTSYLTPPFGWALFFLKGVAPPGVTARDIYRGVIPFIGVQLVALGLVFAFPRLATWLPKAIGW